MNCFKLSISAILIPFGLISCSDDPEPFIPVVGNSPFELYINEINPTGDPDYLEIYNPGTESIDLEGFLIFDDPTDRYTIPAGIVVPAGGYTLFICNGLAIGNQTNFRLDAGGEEQIVLMDPDNNTVDFIEYDDIENNRILGRFPDGSDNLFLSGTPTSESTNGDNPTAYFENLFHDPLVPTIDQEVSVFVEGYHDQNQIVSMEVIYRFNGGAFASQAMTSLNDSTYTADIPATGMDAIVDYYISGVDQNGLSANFPQESPDEFEQYVIDTSPLPLLVINEFLAVNDACCSDQSSGSPEFDDWFEIYNSGTVPVDIGGFYATDDIDDPFQFQFPEDQPTLTTIPAGGYLLVWADGDEDQPGLHTSFRLSSTGETISLHSPDGRAIDSYEFGLQTSDVSVGRSPDGSANWVTFTNPTPGAGN